MWSNYAGGWFYFPILPTTPTTPTTTAAATSQILNNNNRNRPLRSRNPSHNHHNLNNFNHHSTHSNHSENEKLIRKPYHPPSSSKSSHCVWVGNVPSDTSIDELFKFFSRQSPHSPRLTINEYSQLPPNCGVLSIHLINKSRCCFVNFSSQHSLQLAIRDFNNSKLRLGTQRLVVRIRDMKSELSSGVGSQRGQGLHRKWFEQINNDSNDNENDVKRNRSDSIDSTSTSQSFLSKHFPKRYFILKSHRFEDLLASVKTCKWSTQSHNEYVLNKAYKTSEVVYLIFSINKSGGWFGYAKMKSLIPEFNNSNDNDKSNDNNDESQNKNFDIDWVNVQFLPFNQTKLRNPFNGNREVKVSRDGTEIEPSIGEQLIQKWDTITSSDGNVPNN